MCALKWTVHMCPKLLIWVRRIHSWCRLVSHKLRIWCRGVDDCIESKIWKIKGEARRIIRILAAKSYVECKCILKHNFTVLLLLSYIKYIINNMHRDVYTMIKVWFIDGLGMLYKCKIERERRALCLGLDIIKLQRKECFHK